jgi:hypothetical protein
METQKITLELTREQADCLDVMLQNQIAKTATELDEPPSYMTLEMLTKREDFMHQGITVRGVLLQAIHPSSTGEIFRPSRRYSEGVAA